MTRAFKLSEKLAKELGEKAPVKKPTSFATKRVLKSGNKKKDIQQRISDLTYRLQDYKKKLSKATTDKEKEHFKDMIDSTKEYIKDRTAELHEDNEEGEYVSSDPFEDEEGSDEDELEVEIKVEDEEKDDKEKVDLPEFDASVDDSEIDSDDEHLLAVLNKYFGRMAKKPTAVKADKLQELVSRLINVMTNMPRGEKEARNALKMAIKTINENKKVSESFDGKKFKEMLHGIEDQKDFEAMTKALMEYGVEYADYYNDSEDAAEIMKITKELHMKIKKMKS